MNSRASFVFPPLLALTFMLIAGCSAAGELPKPPEHGVSIVLQYAQPANNTNAIAVLKDVAARRLDRYGAKGYFEPISTDKLRVTVPTTDPKQIAALTNLLSLFGVLEFRLVNEGLIPPGKSADDYETLVENRQGTSIKYLVKKSPELSGSHIAHAYVSRNPLSNQPEIMLKFDEAGKNAFSKTTADNVGRQLAIVLDGKLMSAPRINEPIRGGSASLSGNFTMQEAINLANVLEAPFPFSVTTQIEKTF